MNKSKKKDERYFLKWILSGAIYRRWTKVKCLICREFKGRLPDKFDGAIICKDCRDNELN